MPAFDVAIVGLGAMGSAVAWQLAARGRRVVGFDRFAPPHAVGSTHGRSRIIRQAYHEHPLYVPLVQRAYALWEDLTARSGTPVFKETGGVMVGCPESALVRGATESAVTYGLPHELWDADRLRERVPAMAPETGMVALWEPRAGMLAPERAVAAMLGLARAAGATLVTGTRVEGWESGAGGIRIRTSEGVCEAAQLVLAAGPWMPEFVDVRTLPLAVERAVQFWFTPVRPADCAPGRLPVFIVDPGGGPLFYGLPDEGDGVKVAWHHAGETTTAGDVRRLVDEREREAIVALARRWLPAAAGAIRDTAVCLYTNTPDEHFAIDRHPHDRRVIVASPCSGHGFKFASVIGELVADLVDDREPLFDLSPFALSRFRSPS